MFSPIQLHKISSAFRRGTCDCLRLSCIQLSVKADINPDLAAKAALLHDIGHYEWYTDGKWDYEKYKRNDIHAIKGAERAHKLLIRLGEEPKAAKEIALAILLHTDSYLPEGELDKTHCSRLSKKRTNWMKSRAATIITAKLILQPHEKNRKAGPINRPSPGIRDKACISTEQRQLSSLSPLHRYFLYTRLQTYSPKISAPLCFIR